MLPPVTPPLAFFILAITGALAVFSPVASALSPDSSPSCLDRLPGLAKNSNALPGYIHLQQKIGPEPWQNRFRERLPWIANVLVKLCGKSVQEAAEITGLTPEEVSHLVLPVNRP